MSDAHASTERIPARSPRACTAHGDTCAWEDERHEVLRELRGLRDDIKAVAPALATLSALLPANLTERLSTLEATVGTLRLLCYGAVGLCLVTIGGAILALILKGTP